MPEKRRGANGSPLNHLLAMWSDTESDARPLARRNLAAIFRRHSLAESMLVDSAAVGGLECSFHRMLVFIFCSYTHSECKINHSFPNSQILTLKNFYIKNFY